MRDYVPSLAVETIDVDNDRVHYEERETREEVEAEEDDVGGGRGAEEEGEDVHPGSEGHTIGDKQENNGGQDFWV